MSESGWRYVALRDVATDIKDGTHGTHPRVESGIPLLSAKNIAANGKVVWNDEDDTISEEEYRQITSGFSPKTGDLLVTIVGSLGRTAVFNGDKVAFQRSVAFIRPTKEVLPEYLIQASAAPDFTRQLEQRSNATAQAGLYLGELAKVRIPLPSEPQQRRIAEILSTLDEAIEQTEALIAKMQQVKAGLMHDLFTRGVTLGGRLRPTREQAPDLYKKSPLGWIPKEWEVKPLDNHVRIIDCKHYTPEFKTEGYPFVRPRNVKVDGLDLDGVDYVSAEDFQSLTDVYLPRCGDIVFSRNASFGVPCYVDTDVQFAIGQDVVIMTEKVSETRFVFHALTTSTTSAQIAKVSAGSTFGRINLGEIRKLLIPQPDNKEQLRISDRLVACDDHEQKLKDEVAKLRQQKHGLMQDLLTGRVQVPVAKTKKVSTMAHVPSSLELTI